jgi:hypothetical protein
VDASHAEPVSRRGACDKLATSSDCVAASASSKTRRNDIDSHFNLVVLQALYELRA